MLVSRWGFRYIAPPDPDVPSLAPSAEEAEECPTGRAYVKRVLRYVLGITIQDSVGLSRLGIVYK